MPAERPIGYRRFTDGVTRPVFLDKDGREFVIDGDGQRVHGYWLDPRRTKRPDDDPVPIIRGPRQRARESASRPLYIAANLLGGVVFLLLLMDPRRPLWPVLGLLGVAVGLSTTAVILERKK